MSKIIQIKTLYDNYHKFDFGYIGMDLDTKEIKYYSYYNLKQEYNRNFLYEFDPNHLEAGSAVSWHMCHCKQKSGLSEELPEVFEQLVECFINQHKQYNINNNYPIECIDQNSVNLSIQYQSNFSLFDDLKFSATYIPVANVIELSFAKNKWNKLSDHEKGSLIHEIGHMKASSYKLDEVNNLLIVKTGFLLE